MAKNLENILYEIGIIAGQNLCEKDEDVCPADCECDWDTVTRLVEEAIKEWRFWNDFKNFK